jgi:type VI secretion system secreted protein VgrG
MKYKTFILSGITFLAGLPQFAKADMINLGTAGNYAVLAGSTVTNTDNSVINGGDVGVSPGSAITGFPPGMVNAPYIIDNADAAQAQNDLTTAYNVAAGLAPTQILTGQDLGGLTLTPGVYFFSSSAQLTGTLTLNDRGNANAEFVFQIGSTLTTASNSSVVTINDGGSTMDGCNVYWQVGSSATLGTTTAFEGNILALTSITLNTGANIEDGSALARNGAVTLDDNVIDASVCSTSSGSAVPLPSPLLTSLAMLTMLGVGGATFKRAKSGRGTLASPPGEGLC